MCTLLFFFNLKVKIIKTFITLSDASLSVTGYGDNEDDDRVSFKHYESLQFFEPFYTLCLRSHHLRG